MARLLAGIILFVCLCSFASASLVGERKVATKVFSTVSLPTIVTADDSYVGTYYKTVFNTTVSGIHAVIMPDDSMIIMDRTDARNTLIKLPHSNVWAYAVKVVFEPFKITPLNVLSNLFCSGGALLSNGSFLSIGGAANASAYGDTYASRILNGSWSLRMYNAKNHENEFLLVNDLTSKRWYPYAQRLEDGRIFIIGGANVYGNIAINSLAYNNPTFEFYPRKKGEGNYYLDLLTTSLPFNLYPFVHLIGPQLLYIFAGLDSIVFNYSSQAVVITLPPIPSPNGLYRLYPVSSSFAALPITVGGQYSQNIIVVGGNLASAYGNIAIGASSQTALITPLAGGAKWITEDMILPRFEPDIVLTSDGNAVVLDGCKNGYEGLGPYSKNPTMQAVIYNVSAPIGKRFYKPVGATTPYARGYHSCALLDKDNTILVSGSNPNPYYVGPNIAKLLYTQMAAERFYPPYFSNGRPFGTLKTVPTQVYYGTPFFVTGVITEDETDTNGGNFAVYLIDGGFCTHNHRMGQRMLQLLSYDLVRSAKGGYSIGCTVSKDFLAPAGFYRLSVSYKGQPSSSMLGLYVGYPPAKKA